MRRLTKSTLVAMAITATPAGAQEAPPASIQQQLDTQKERIRLLEALVAEQAELLRDIRAGQAASNSPPRGSVSPHSTEDRQLASKAVSERPLASSFAPAIKISGLDLSGDLRLREEFNWSIANARNRARSVMRVRLRGTYTINPNITIGGEIATGDPDDPNSTDVTLSNFNDDLDTSLDQAWLRFTSGGLVVTAGKFPQIFQRTDMIWDSDVMPEGIGATYGIAFGDTHLDARAVYFVIDEAAAASDSDMIGGQLVFAAPVSRALRLTLAGSYFHYRLGSVAGADTGDFRSNLISNSRYLSDFHLIEGLATLTWTGPGPRWPISLAVDYVRNLGSAVPADSGFNIEFAAGRTAMRGDWRIAYNYSEVGVDAVFAAFTHDNLNTATNYKLHGFSLAYSPAKDLIIDLSFYHYRPLDPLYAGLNSPADWLNRIRLNLLVNF
ncbi:MAG: putative porin [Novosphingobium sp.]